MKVPHSHRLENESRRTFMKLLPSAWIARDKYPDYAIDMEVEIVEENKFLWVQIKAKERVKKRSDGNISFSMCTRHLEHYENCQLPVIIVLWVKCENSFYCLFAQRFIQEELSAKKPNWRAQKTNTITFSPDSKLNNVDILRLFATDGYLYIISQELNVKPDTKSAYYWFDGILLSDNKELKERTLKALLYVKAEKYHDALREFDNILRVCMISPTEKMSILLNLGNAHLSLSQNDEALINYSAILELTKKVSGKDALEGKASALGNIGLIYLVKGELDNGLKYLEDALKIYREIGCRQGEAYTLGSIGLIYKDKGELDKALKYHRDALKILDEANSAYGLDIIRRVINSIKNAE